MYTTRVHVASTWFKKQKKLHSNILKAECCSFSMDGVHSFSMANISFQICAQNFESHSVKCTHPICSYKEKAFGILRTSMLIATYDVMYDQLLIFIHCMIPSSIHKGLNMRPTYICGDRYSSKTIVIVQGVL